MTTMLAGCAGAPAKRGPRVHATARGAIPVVRVAIAKDARQVGISSAAALNVIAGQQRFSLKPSGRWKFVAEGPNLILEDEAGGDVREVQAPLWVRVSGPSGGTITVNGRSYRGSLEVVRGSGPGLTVVNEVEVEDYIRSVVPSEMGRIDERTQQAAYALAVAARTYALYRVGTRPEKGYDLECSEADQIYAGVGAETAVADRAVERTHGLVLEHQGKLIRANYHAICGGLTAGNEEVLPEKPRPYLQPVKDRYCRSAPRFAFTRTLTGEELLAALRSVGSGSSFREGGEPRVVTDVRIKEKGRSGRVVSLLVKTDGNDILITKGKIRSFLADPKTGALLPSSLFELEVRRHGGSVASARIEGTGNGHGLGMCVWGAVGMAREGMDYRRILDTYYRHTRIVKLYS
jgi:stage II sporulation protein D